MSFNRTKVSGWAFGEILTSAQMNSLDTDHANAIDGVGGGVYSPSAEIEIADGGLHLTGGSFVSEVGLGVSAGLAIFADGILNGDTLTQAGLAVFQGTVEVQGALTADSTLHSVGAATFDTTLTASGPIVLSGTGRVRERVVSGASANTSYGIGDATVIVARGSMGSGKTWTITTTGAAVGDTMTFLNWSINTVAIAGVGISTTLPILNTSVSGVGAVPGRVVIMYHDDGSSTGWHIVDYTKP